MIKKNVLGDYEAVCDGCKLNYGVVFYSYKDAETELEQADWLITAGARRPCHFCTECSEKFENTNSVTDVMNFMK